MLSVLDISNIVYCGHLGNQNFVVEGFPVGGIRKVLGIIDAFIPEDDFALCFDSSTVRKELDPNYKSGRIPDYSVYAQIKLLEEILTECNIPILKREGMEADDLAFSLCHTVNQLRGIPNSPVASEVRLFTGDHDYACCVNEHTFIQNVYVGGSCIDMRNYEVKAVAGARVAYNTVLLHKIVHGDASDRYGALKIPGVTYESLCTLYEQEVKPAIDAGQATYALYADYNVFEALAKEFLLPMLSPDEGERLMVRARIVFPYQVDIFQQGFQSFSDDYSANMDRSTLLSKHLGISTRRSIDYEKLVYFCWAMRFKSRRKTSSLSGTSFDEGFKQKLRAAALDLSSGATAADLHSKRKSKLQVCALDCMTIPEEEG